jgi:hypothetical protein
LGNVFKSQLTFVEIKPVFDHIPGIDQVLEPIIVEVTNCSTSSVVEILVFKDVEGFLFNQEVSEIYIGLASGNLLKCGAVRSRTLAA